MSRHLGQEYVLSLVREKFWLIKARSGVPKVLRDCATYKRVYAKPSVQTMANLSVERVLPNEPPFSHVGVDYFGPLCINVGLCRVKRYCCLFTCLSTRTIHIEVSSNLETDSFINALQRFVCRRGLPVDILQSDRFC